MIKKIDHIAFAVKDAAATRARLEKVYGAKFLIEEKNDQGQYRVMIFQLGEDMVTLLESTSPDGFVAKHIEKFGEGVQHIGVEVESLEKAKATFAANGLKYVPGSDISGVRQEVILGGRSAFGVNLQVTEYLGEAKHLSDAERLKMCWKK